MNMFLQYKNLTAVHKCKNSELIFDADQFYGIYRRSRLCLFMPSQSEHDLLPILGVPELSFFKWTLFKTRAKDYIWTNVLLPEYDPYGWIHPQTLITKIRSLGPVPESGWGSKLGVLLFGCKQKVQRKLLLQKIFEKLKKVLSSSYILIKTLQTLRCVFRK